MGDLVIGARSGVGEPEDSNGRTVGSVDDMGRGEAAQEKSEAAEMGDQVGGATAGSTEGMTGSSYPGRSVPESHDIPQSHANFDILDSAVPDGGVGGPDGLGGPGGPGGPSGPGGAGGGAGGPAGDGGSASQDESDEQDAEKKKAKKQQRSFWKELPILIVVALVLALLIKTFLVQAFSIPSGSMEDTLQIGDRVLVDKLTPNFGAKPSRGEVVVFHDPSDWLAGEPGEQPSSNPVIRGLQDALSFIGLMPSVNEKDLIKRVIAVGGDTISCHGNGPVYVNGKALNEPYLFPGSTPCGDKNFGPLKVPADSIWVMGDHRQDSLDSRYHMDEPGGGAVPDSKVVGRAIVVAWPISHWKTLPIPDTFSQPGINNQAVALAAGSSPALLGLVGAVPITWINRRRKLRQK